MNQADQDQPNGARTGLTLGSSAADAGDRPGRPSPVAAGGASPVSVAGASPVSVGGASPVADRQATTTVPGQGPTARRSLRPAARHPVTVHLAVLLGYIAAGIAVTWPHASYLAGRLPATLDAGSYVWGFWWMLHSVEHLSNPWSTSYMAAPVGTQLGLHALMPLAGVVMLPVTAAFGPSAAYTLLSVLLPGLLSYAMYRVARLWVPSQIAAIAAGAFFGFSAIVSKQDWIHLNLVAGALFLPLALEAAVRLRRRPGFRQAVVLGVVIGASLLVDQESAVLAAVAAAAALLPWVLTGPRLARLLRVGASALVAAVVASPQLIAIAHEAAVGGPPLTVNAIDYRAGFNLPGMFAPSPRVTEWGLKFLSLNSTATYGVVLTGLAVIGLILARRRLHAWLLALLWLGAALLALGAVLHIGTRTYIPVPQNARGVQISSVMPFTWFVHVPGLSGFREPSRIAELGLVPAALLAGFAVNWLRYHAVPVLVAVLALGVLEAGISTPPNPTMPTALPALDRPIAADHSGSTVIDVPFGLRGGIGITGKRIAYETLVLATADGHPVADAYLSRIPRATTEAIADEPFYGDLMRVQSGHHQFSAAELQAAASNARSMHIGWVLLWVQNRHLQHYLAATGFRFSYRADGVSVYRPTPVGR